MLFKQQCMLWMILKGIEALYKYFCVYYLSKVIDGYRKNVLIIRAVNGKCLIARFEMKEIRLCNIISKIRFFNVLLR